MVCKTSKQSSCIVSQQRDSPSVTLKSNIPATCMSDMPTTVFHRYRFTGFGFFVCWLLVLFGLGFLVGCWLFFVFLDLVLFLSGNAPVPGLYEPCGRSCGSWARAVWKLLEASRRWGAAARGEVLRRRGALGTWPGGEGGVWDGGKRWHGVCPDKRAGALPRAGWEGGRDPFPGV